MNLILKTPFDLINAQDPVLLRVLHEEEGNGEDGAACRGCLGRFQGLKSKARREQILCTVEALIESIAREP